MAATDQIRQMVNFILQEAHEKANEIRVKVGSCVVPCWVGGLAPCENESICKSVSFGRQKLRKQKQYSKTAIVVGCDSLLLLSLSFPHPEANILPFLSRHGPFHSDRYGPRWIVVARLPAYFFLSPYKFTHPYPNSFSNNNNIDRTRF
jgi:hypothetical protein